MLREGVSRAVGRAHKGGEPRIQETSNSGAGLDCGVWAAKRVEGGATEGGAVDCDEDEGFAVHPTRTGDFSIKHDRYPRACPVRGNQQPARRLAIGRD
jgi:hypothetical protein